MNNMNGFTMPMFFNVTGYVYFIQMDRIGAIKIGYTTDVEKRIASLQTASPYKLYLLCVFPANEEIERQLHYCFRDVRLEGEWFLPHPFLLKELDLIINLNKKHGFKKPNPEFDIHDNRLLAIN